MILRKTVLLTAFVLAAGVADLAQATDLSFTGNFVYDNDVQKFSFNLVGDSSVTLRSWSYAGGVNAAGQTIAAGGFDPILSLFDGAGNLIAEQDDGDPGSVAVDPKTREGFDVNLATTLVAGAYTVSIQEYDNFSRGSLGLGYYHDGDVNRNFANGFVDITGSQRTSGWAFDILGADTATQEPPSSAVPEPASLALVGLGSVAMMLRRRRQG
jgi:hypothetical protein